MKDFQHSKKKPRKFKNIVKDKKAFPDNELAGKNPQKNVSLKESGRNYFLAISSLKTWTRPLFYTLLVILPVSLLTVLLFIYKLNGQTVEQIKQTQLVGLDYKIDLAPYPNLGNFKTPDMSAQAAIIIDPDSRVVLFSKNSTLRLSTASTTKLMTALVGLDYYRENSVLTIFSPNIEGSYIGVHSGEQYYFKDLLYAMFLPSSNEAAYTVAQNYPGGMEAFVAKMNEKAGELNLINTHFSDPAGLNDDANYSTVSDLSRLASIVIKNELLAKIAATKQTTIADITGKNKIVLNNLNKLLGKDGVNGVKTGTTEGAGEVLVTSKADNGHTFIIVVMKSKDRFTDTKNLLSLISNNIHYYTPPLPGSLNGLDNPLSYSEK